MPLTCATAFDDTISTFVNGFTSNTIYPLLSYIHYTISKNTMFMITCITTILFSPLTHLLEQPLYPYDPTSLTIRESMVRFIGYCYIAYFPSHLVQAYTPVWIWKIMHSLYFYSAAWTTTVPCLYVKQPNFRGYWFSRADKQGIKSINQDTKVLLYIHGGGFNMGTARQSSAIFSHIIKRITGASDMDIRIFSVEYPLLQPKLGKLEKNEYATEHCVQDCVAAYDYLTSQLKIESKNIVIAGESAGGNLAAVLALVIRDSGKPQPAGVVLVSPWVDVDVDLWPHDSECHDFLSSRSSHRTRQWFDTHYYGQHKHPYQSPLHDPHELEGIAPLFVWYGKKEMLYKGIHLFVKKAAKSDVLDEAVCNPRLYHVAPILATALGGQSWEELNHIIDWIQRKLQTDSKHGESTADMDQPPPTVEYTTFEAPATVASVGQQALRAASPMRGSAK